MATQEDPRNPLLEVHHLRKELEEMVESLNHLEGACVRVGLVGDSTIKIAASRGNLKVVLSNVRTRQRELKLQ